MTKRKCENIQL